MSQENVEIVRRVWEILTPSFEEGDPAAGYKAAFDQGLFSPASTLAPDPEHPEPQTYVGREGFSEFLRARSEEWVALRMWPEKIIDAGDERVVAIVRQSAKGRASGAEVEHRLVVVYTISGGQVIDRRHHLGVSEALEALGLSE
jgi:ketosteroid isomerase-like protein